MSRKNKKKLKTRQKERAVVVKYRDNILRAVDAGIKAQSKDLRIEANARASLLAQTYPEDEAAILEAFNLVAANGYLVVRRRLQKRQLEAKRRGRK